MSGLVDLWRDHWEQRHGQAMRLATHPDTDDLYRWEDGVWRNLTPQFARTIMTEAATSTSRYQVEQALYEVTNLSPYLDGEMHGLDSPAPRINFTNGVLDLTSGDLLPHGEPWNTVNQIPHRYVKDIDSVDLELATLPLDTFLRDRMAEDTVSARVPWQLLGWAMLPGNPAQVFVVLSGPGGSGKSTFVGLMADLLGPDNVSTLTLGQLDDRFAAAGLHGTLANIAGDVAGGIVPSYELVLSIVGGDKVTADRKYRTPLAFTWDGLLILATNGRLILPSAAGAESGWWRRALYLDMPNAVPEGSRTSPGALRQQIAPDLDLIATRAARELRTAWLDGTAPTITPTMTTSSTTARMTGDVVTDWVQDRLTPQEGSRVPGQDAYRDYKSWCSHFGHHPKGHRAFYNDLETILRARGLGTRIENRSSSSRAVFTGIAIEPRPVWQRV